MKDTSGPAFPRTLYDGDTDTPHTQTHGMSMRDYFAAAALPSVVLTCANDACGNLRREQYFAEVAYHLADEMLAERLK